MKLYIELLKVEGGKLMKKLRRLTRAQKLFLVDQGYHPEDFLLERNDAWSIVFFNIHTGQLMEFRY